MKQYKKHSTNNSKQSKNKYNVHITKTPTHTLTHTLQNQLKQYKLKQTQYKIYPNEIVTFIQVPWV
jgi:DNA-directed RNA polymerase specialized sigma54-like protein